MKRELYSKTLHIPYVSLDNGYVTEDGVFFTKEEAKADKEIVKRMYEERKKSGPLYDYRYAISTGFLRKHRASQSSKKRFKEKLISGITYEVSTIQQKNRKHVPISIQILRFVMSIIGCIAIALSTSYTYQFLVLTNGPFIALALSSALIIFSVTASTIVVLFLKQHHFALALLFIVIWVIVVTYSMFSTVYVNYSMYYTHTEQKTESIKSVATSSARLKNLEDILQTYKEDLKTKQDLLKSLLEKSSPAWMVSQVQAEIGKLLNKISDIQKQMDAVYENNEYAAVAQDVIEQKRDLYDDLERMFKIPKATLFFAINTLPAVFIDIIAPVAVASATFLGDLYAKQSTNNESTDSEKTSEGSGLPTNTGDQRYALRKRRKALLSSEKSSRASEKKEPAILSKIV